MAEEIPPLSPVLSPARWANAEAEAARVREIAELDWTVGRELLHATGPGFHATLRIDWWTRRHETTLRPSWQLTRTFVGKTETARIYPSAVLWLTRRQPAAYAWALRRTEEMALLPTSNSDNDFKAALAEVR